MRLANALLALMLPRRPPRSWRAIERSTARMSCRTGTRPRRAGGTRARCSSIATCISVVGARARPRMPHSRESRMASFRQDLSVRAPPLRTQPGFTAVAVPTLGLGIGANVAIFPSSTPSSTSGCRSTRPTADGRAHAGAGARRTCASRSTVWSYPKYQLFREQQRAFAATADLSWRRVESHRHQRALNDSGQLVEGVTSRCSAPRWSWGCSPSTKHRARAPRLAVLGHGCGCAGTAAIPR